MRSLRIGAVLLSLWSGLNLLLALGILAAMTFAGHHAPGLSLFLSEAESSALAPKVVATVDSIALLANACIAGLCLLVLSITWTWLVEGSRRALAMLAGATILVQVFGFVADDRTGDTNLVANAVSTGILLVGLGLAARAVFRPGKAARA